MTSLGSGLIEKLMGQSVISEEASTHKDLGLTMSHLELENRPGIKCKTMPSHTGIWRYTNWLQNMRVPGEKVRLLDQIESISRRQ